MQNNDNQNSNNTINQINFTNENEVGENTTENNNISFNQIDSLFDEKNELKQISEKLENIDLNDFEKLNRILLKFKKSKKEYIESFKNIKKILLFFKTNINKEIERIREMTKNPDLYNNIENEMDNVCEAIERGEEYIKKLLLVSVGCMRRCMKKLLSDRNNSVEMNNQNTDLNSSTDFKQNMVMAIGLLNKSAYIISDLKNLSNSLNDILDNLKMIDEKTIKDEAFISEINAKTESLIKKLSQNYCKYSEDLFISWLYEKEKVLIHDNLIIYRQRLKDLFRKLFR